MGSAPLAPRASGRRVAAGQTGPLLSCSAGCSGHGAHPTALAPRRLDNIILAVWLAIPSSALTPGGLIGSVFLVRHGMELTVDSAAGKSWVRAGRVLPLAIVSFLGLVWSFLTCVVILYKVRSERRSRRFKVWVRGILATSALSLAGWAALLMDDYVVFLAVSSSRAGC